MGQIGLVQNKVLIAVLRFSGTNQGKQRWIDLPGAISYFTFDFCLHHSFSLILVYLL